MVSHLDSFLNGGKRQLGNSLLRMASSVDVYDQGRCCREQLNDFEKTRLTLWIFTYKLLNEKKYRWLKKKNVQLKQLFYKPFKWLKLKLKLQPASFDRFKPSDEAGKNSREEFMEKRHYKKCTYFCFKLWFHHAQHSPNSIFLNVLSYAFFVFGRIRRSRPCETLEKRLTGCP